MARDLFWLNEEEWTRIEPYLPRGRRGARRVDDKVMQDEVFIERFGFTHQCNSCVPDCKRGNLVSDKRLSVRRRVQLMRYESEQPEPGPTTGDIYAT